MHTTDSQFETYCKLGREVLLLMACAGGAPPEKFREICHLAWVCERAQ